MELAEVIAPPFAATPRNYEDYGCRHFESEFFASGTFVSRGRSSAVAVSRPDRVMTSFKPPESPSSTSQFTRLSNRVVYGIVRRLVRLIQVGDSRSITDTRVDDTTDSQDVTLISIVRQLRAQGSLELRGDELTTISEITFASTGSSVNVAIIPEDALGRALVLKYTDSAMASAELSTSSAVQEQLTVDTRFSSWSSYIPRVLASGVVGTTTFAIEQRLSSRDGSAVDHDLAATNSLITDALKVIDDFQRVGARHRRVDEDVLGAIVVRPIEVLRSTTPTGVFGFRARSIDRLGVWLRHSLLDLDLEVGWTHGDYHLGNVLIDDHGDHVVGVIDWGRAESDGLTILDGFTLIVWERAKIAGKEISTFVLELLRDDRLPPIERAHLDVLTELETLLPRDSSVDLGCLLMLTWLKHVANNLKNEDRSRSHGLWRLRTVDLVLYGAAEILAY